MVIQKYVCYNYYVCFLGGCKALEITVNNININYISEGQGEVVLILHGWGTNIEVYRGIINELSPHMRVVALDMPGFGKTPEPPASWCVDEYVNLVVGFINALGIKKLSLIGHSFGGRIIFKLFALQNKGFDIEKAVLIDSAGIRPKLSLKKRIRQRYYKICKRVLSIGIVKWFYPDALSALQSRFGSADYNSATPIMRETLVKVVNEDLSHIIPLVCVPALLIWGENDTATPFSDAEKLQALIPDSGIVKIKGAGHYSFLEQPATVRFALHSFFNIKEGN